VWQCLANITRPWGLSTQQKNHRDLLLIQIRSWAPLSLSEIGFSYAAPRKLLRLR